MPSSKKLDKYMVLERYYRLYWVGLEGIDDSADIVSLWNIAYAYSAVDRYRFEGSDGGE